MTKQNMKLILICFAFCCLGMSYLCVADDSSSQPAPRNIFAEKGQFIQIPGPNPLLGPGDQSAWDGAVVEAGNVFKDGDKYYFYYHGTPRDKKKMASRRL